MGCNLKWWYNALQDVTLAGAIIDSTASGTTAAGANITFSGKANGAQNLSVNSGTVVQQLSLVL